MSVPDATGHFGRFGGRFVAETLIGPLEELAAAYDAARVDPAFAAGIVVDNRDVRIDRVLSNSFGFGGSNCALVIGRLP